MAAIAPPLPKSLLARHRLLAPSASIRVSPLCLGGMGMYQSFHLKAFVPLKLVPGFGTAWQGFMGVCSKDTTFGLLDTFYDLGGNFIDTANVYQGGQSEQWIGEWLKKTGRRDEMVIATKYTMSPLMTNTVQTSNFAGTGTKSMHLSIAQSLENLQTNYVDIYYVHAFDYATSVPELMQSLNNLVAQGKVLYLGISDCPAWFVVKCNAYARQHGLRPFSVYQGQFSAQQRDLEREIIPMCQDEGMAIQAFGVLGGGSFKSPDSAPEAGGRNAPSHFLTGREEQVSAALDKVARRCGVPITSVALAYAMHKTPYLFPIIGGRKVEHLKSNVEALGLELSHEDVEAIEKAYDFDIGFPHSLISSTGQVPRGPQDIGILASLGHFDYVAPSVAIKPYKGDLAAP
ncbi:aryl-alcohol dehydrogenase [Coniella lustricola]|uniref:Aryl-alcohol dehydrogenase n=1 Tax=Coniella lustricola TaxID=2025994 RepID=A0A2T3AD60_9PEZI|nr:aryl-alcohol dehydrogenase [Coniella lustricola]